jgi:hypothetical protein
MKTMMALALCRVVVTTMMTMLWMALPVLPVLASRPHRWWLAQQQRSRLLKL